MNLRCLAYAWPKPMVQWWHGESPVPLSTRHYEFSREYSLLIRSLQLSQLGEYTCQAYNGIGKATSWTVTLKAIKPVNIQEDQLRLYAKYLLTSSNEPVVITPRPQRPVIEEPSPEIIPEVRSEPPTVYSGLFVAYPYNPIGFIAHCLNVNKLIHNNC